MQMSTPEFNATYDFVRQQLGPFSERCNSFIAAISEQVGAISQTERAISFSVFIRPPPLILPFSLAPTLTAIPPGPVHTTMLPALLQCLSSFKHSVNRLHLHEFRFFSYLSGLKNWVFRVRHFPPVEMESLFVCQY
jgi:hypothetical protein